jgi:hypothetical protein
VLVLAGGFLLANRRTRAAATVAGLAVVLALVWVYLPMLFKAPTEMVALNYFFDSLLYCGTLLLLGNAMEDVI